MELKEDGFKIEATSHHHCDGQCDGCKTIVQMDCLTIKDGQELCGSCCPVHLSNEYYAKMYAVLNLIGDHYASKRN